ncbi:MAG: prepilin-type N-terminal cleavage/methylation domain-containing protein [Xanthomonadales bacterium]|nr:prepilin-type N-terminal cleavage/methylation domain-containing protein [Xanthomonadales bacterium]
MGAERRRRGTTLLELLVVVVILAVLAGAVGLAAGLARRPSPEQAARDRLARGLALACERARLGGLDHGLLIDKGGYAFAFFDGTAWQRYGSGEDAPLAPGEWPEGVRPELLRQGIAVTLPERAERPEIACTGSGELSPFELALRPARGEGAPRLRGALDGRLERLGGDRR